jgi:hypothetical protein
MTELFGFDAKSLSDDQLFTKQIELSRQKAIVNRMGHGDSANQLDLMIQAIEHERRERMFLDRVKMQPASPVVIETDPAMREQEAVIEEIKAQRIKPPRAVRRAIRSASPVVTSDGS